jgi:hypothetical protein
MAWKILFSNRQKKSWTEKPSLMNNQKTFNFFHFKSEILPVIIAYQS